MGASAGGLLMGAVANMAPHLFHRSVLHPLQPLLAPPDPDLPGARAISWPLIRGSRCGLVPVC